MASSDEQTIAQELSNKQREISVAEFFEQNRQMLGFGSKARAMVTAVKEGVDNAIDAAEDADILPYVRVEIHKTDDSDYRVTIQDNGPGITRDHIPKVFGKLLYGSRFSKRVQRRGQQGIGISAAVLYGQLTTGKPAEVVSKVKESDTAQQFKVGIDTDTNEPKIQDSNKVDWKHDSESGTAISINIEANFRSRKSLHEYIRHTAVVNPHATVELVEPEKTLQYERTVTQLPEQPTEIDPHPHGIEFGTLRSLIEVTNSHSISGFLQSEFTRVGETTAHNIIQIFLDTHYGRHLTWPFIGSDKTLPASYLSGEDIYTNQLQVQSQVQSEGITIEDYIRDSINRKSDELEEKFIQELFGNLSKGELTSKQSIVTLVSNIADRINNAGEFTIGDTVKQNIIDSTWDVVRVTRYQHLYKLIDDVTTQKKTDSDIEKLTQSVIELIDNTGESELPRKKLREIVETATARAETDSSIGDTAIENIVSELWEAMQKSQRDPPLIRELESNRDLAESLHTAMQQADVISPPSHCLSPIGEEEIEKGMKKVYNADFYSSSSRDAQAHSGDPFLIEAGIAYGGDIPPENEITLLRFANRVPLVYQQGACATTKVLTSIRWNNYKLSHKGGGLPQGPVAIMIHVASTNVPFTSESKDAVASSEIIENEIERAVRDVARDLKSHLQKEENRKKQQRKQSVIDDILPDFSKKVASITGNESKSTDESLTDIMNGIYVNVHPNDDSIDVQISNYANSTVDCSVTVTKEDGTEVETSQISISRDERDTKQINTSPSSVGEVSLNHPQDTPCNINQL